MDITTRPVRPDDREFVRAVHHAAFRDVVEREFGRWDDAEQDGFFTREWDDAGGVEIVVVDGVPAGYMAADDNEDAIAVRQLVLGPEHQGRGTGTRLLREFIQRGRLRMVPVRLGCLRANRAAGLYRLLGFRPKGESEHHLFFEWSPLVESIEACRDAHRRLLATVEDLDEATARQPSRLPDWSVGHVLTHLARNADSHVRILEGAGRGEMVEQYAGGHEQRASDIEAGAARSAAKLVADVRGTASVLEDVWAQLPEAAWSGAGLTRGEPWPARLLPFHRWREVEVHHVDLGLGYDATDWPSLYVEWELPHAVATMPDRLSDPGQRASLLAWLFGRGGMPAQLALDSWQSRSAYYHGGLWR